MDVPPVIIHFVRDVPTQTIQFLIPIYETPHMVIFTMTTTYYAIILIYQLLLRIIDILFVYTLC